ncbi:class I SAM-dependent methyltransferase [Sphingomonas hankyongi]|uniref:Class I SAM-dependent methyltransferase n=1 Tax=Sphingomonas hankyongi TaxID=2908209 RepID=A0ABT0RYW9_9SPHN|nr:class I SAM-dependent methyltransferase [Sphingomonas hankyongi]MCL6728804.1 class I SAM-dependent methyltransferase [Sphingomonas hankyongi]
MWNRRAAAALILGLAACRAEPSQPQFPKAERKVSPIVGDAFSTEDARDRVGEAEQVIQLAGVKPGMSVADVGAGEGYYTVRLARTVGPKGRVLAEDIMPAVRDSLSQRVQREQLDNVAVKLGSPDNPMLPQQSFDRVFLVHMYHEVQSPYAFLWHLRDALKPGGLVIVVDSNRATDRHGIPPQQLRCELAALALQSAHFEELPSSDAYLMAFRSAGPKPEPSKIKPCRSERS